MTVRIRSTVEQLPPYRALSGKRPPVRLDGNESPLGPSPRVAAALATSDAASLARYPAVEALRRRWARQLRVPPRRLLLTSGSGPAIALAAELVIDPGDVAVMLAPSFELYGLALRRREARIVAVPAPPARAFPFKAVRRALGAGMPRLCLLGLPDNPSGVGPDRRQVRSLLAACPDTLFLIDEAYAEFTGRSVLPLTGSHPNLLVLRTMSKAWGLAGERVGAVVGARRLVDRLARLNVPYPVTALAATAATAALTDVRHVRRAVAHVRRERPALAKSLRGLGLRVRETPANFVLVDRGSADAAAAFAEALKMLGVAVRDRSHLPDMAGQVRVSVGTVADHALLTDAVRILTVPAPDALLLDMDGTLVDVSRSYDEIIWRMVRRHAGRRAGSRADVLAIKNDPGANDDVDAILLALERRGVSIPREEVAREFVARYRGPSGLHRLERWLLRVEDVGALASFVPLAVVTGRPKKELDLALARLPVRRAFRALVSADDTGRHKPDPQPIREAQRRLGCRRPWMVGDSPADLLAARAARVPAVAIGSGARGDMLREFGPLAVLDGAARLLDVFRARALLRSAATKENR